MAVNGRGVFLCYKHAAEQMIQQGKGGRIIGASYSLCLCLLFSKRSES
jgi:NAD(P)-dependent dehydrogenase (short-subunit alcohol dehydrogenase family)